MKIQEASKEFTEGEYMFPGPETSYMEANTLKDLKMDKKGPERTHMRLGHGVCAPSTEECGQKTTFPTFLWEKSRFLGPTSCGNSPYKYCIPHS